MGTSYIPRKSVHFFPSFSERKKKENCTEEKNERKIRDERKDREERRQRRESVERSVHLNSSL